MGTGFTKKESNLNIKRRLPSYAKLPYLDSKKEYKAGSTGDEVKAAQQMLQALGYKLNATGGFRRTDGSCR